MNRIVFTTVFLLGLLVIQPLVVNAREIRIWTARAIATVLAEIGPEFERKTGHKLIVSSDLPPAFSARADKGEEFDLLITSSSVIDDWIAAGRIIPNTRTSISRSGIGVGVRVGTRRPNISSVEAFKQAL